MVTSLSLTLLLSVEVLVYQGDILKFSPSNGLQNLQTWYQVPRGFINLRGFSPHLYSPTFLQCDGFLKKQQKGGSVYASPLITPLAHHRAVCVVSLKFWSYLE